MLQIGHCDYMVQEHSLV